MDMGDNFGERTSADVALWPAAAGLGVGVVY